MNNITIITAFFDIGRGNWTPDKGLPHYLQRTTETYLERFKHLCKLDNEMIIFTSHELMPTIRDMRKNKITYVLTVDFNNSFNELRTKIQNVQKNPEFQKKINPMQVRNPEYWSADYVLVNLLKSSFVNRAISMQMIKDDLVAWLDFGYCRNADTLNGIKKWSYPFNKEKIHFFNIKDWQEGTYIQDVISNNDVHITGPCIVADKKLWPTLEHMIHHNLNELLKNDLIDDDQTLLLMSYLSKPDLFELHKVSNNDWFTVFKDYNEITS